MTATTKPLPPHGTDARYDRGCRNPCCRDAHNAYKRLRYRLQAYGRWEPLTDAEPVRQHIRLLMAKDIGWKRIAKLAGVNTSVVGYLLYGNHGRIQKKLRTENAQKILAVKAPTTVADRKPVGNTGTRRRLEALGCRGYSCERIAHEIGVWPETVRKWRRGAQVEAQFAQAVADLFMRWEMHDAETNGSTPLSAAQTRARATRQGWQPPMAWDLESIDDPDAQPIAWSRAGKRRQPADLAEDVEFIIRTAGVSITEATARLGTTRHVLSEARKLVAAVAEAGAA